MAAALLVAAPAADASAQTFTWRVPNYGTEFSTAGLAPQSLAIDTANNPFAFAFIANAGEMQLRLSHYQGSDGAVIWQKDIGFNPMPWFPFLTYVTGHPTAALASAGTHVVLATTNYDTRFYGQIALYSGSDGSAIWQSAEHAQTDLAYEAVAVDGNGNVVAAGVTGETNVTPYKGHVAKFRAGDGSLAWRVDLDSAACGAGTSFGFNLTSVSVDGNGDVIAAGFAEYDQLFPFCAFKLSGVDGTVEWTYADLDHGAYFVSTQLDPGGNPIFASAYNTGLAIVKVDGVTGIKAWSHDPVGGNSGTFGAPPFAITAAGDVVVSAGTTRAYASSDGHALWPQDAPITGAPAVDSSGNILISHYAWLDGDIELFRLSTADGSPLWNTKYPLDTDGSWDPLYLIQADGSGHFYALQSFSKNCCEDKQTLLLRGTVSDGTVDWHASDRNVAPSNASQAEPDPVFARTSALTPDGGIVGVGTTYLGVTGSSDRITVIKRSVADGHLLWRTVPDLSLDTCVPAELIVDGNGDVIVGGRCASKAQTLKFRGSDGLMLWAASKQDGCDHAAVQSVAVDSGNDVYATGWCQESGSASQLTARFNGTTGAPSWQVLTAAALSSYSQFLVRVDASGGVIIGGVENFSGQPYSPEASLIVRKLHAADGSTSWSQRIDPPAGGAEDLAAMSVYPGGDVAVTTVESVMTSNTLVARLRANDGAIKWATHDTAAEMTNVTPVAMALDDQGNLALAGRGGAWKYSGATGTRSWKLHGLPPEVTGTTFNDVIVAPDGNIAVTGACDIAGRSVPNLCVVVIAPGTGTPVWTAVDTPAEPGYSVGIGVLSGSDGAFIVSGNNAVPGASPWSLVRVAGPSTDDLFANSFEQ